MQSTLAESGFKCLNLYAAETRQFVLENVADVRRHLNPSTGAAGFTIRASTFPRVIIAINSGRGMRMSEPGR
jgi:hypothetical protein